MNGGIKRAFKHEQFEKDTSTYKDTDEFFRDQLSQEIQDNFQNDSMSDEFPLEDLLQPDTVQAENSVSESPTDSPQLSPKPEKQPIKRVNPVTNDDIESLASKPTTNSMTKWGINVHFQPCSIITR